MSKNIIIKEFDKDIFDIGFDKPLTKRDNDTNARKKSKNINKYADWIVERLYETAASSDYWKLKIKMFGDFNKWQPNATSVHMNKHNLDIMQDCFNPMDWANLSPKEDNSLTDKQYSIKIKEALTERE